MALTELKTSDVIHDLVLSSAPSVPVLPHPDIDHVSNV